MAGNDWIDSYLEAILDIGPGLDDAKSSLLLRERGRFTPTRYFVDNVIGFDETDLHHSWVKVQATRSPQERNTRLENMSWRIWNLARQKNTVMASFMKEFEHLKIQLEEIKSATQNFDQTKVIGSGGFGKVYKAEVSHLKGKSLVAVKRLDRKFGQGDPEFLKEIMMLSRYSHKNLISLLGYCDEAGEKILVYEYASNRSLDLHLSSKALSWSQRIKICLDAARGLCYLHDDIDTHQRVLHRDIKSANILLDEKWTAKISDLGLSKLGPANQQHTAFVTSILGTFGYIDPMYLQMNVLTKESDVYSFGVVLMEVLCGKLCFYNNMDGSFTNLVRTWKKSCKAGQLDKIVFQDVAQPLHPDSLKSFSKIAVQCLKKLREGRPLMSVVVKELETSLKLQEPHDLRPIQLGEVTATESKDGDGGDPNNKFLLITVTKRSDL